MNTTYVIFGFEWTTDELGAAPEFSQYKVLKVLYSGNDAPNIQINNEFLAWREEARESVWSNFLSSTFAKSSYAAALNLIRDFKKNSKSCWYTLTEIEYNEWCEWAGSIDNDEIEVEILDLTAAQ